MPGTRVSALGPILLRQPDHCDVGIEPIGLIKQFANPLGMRRILLASDKRGLLKRVAGGL